MLCIPGRERKDEHGSRVNETTFFHSKEWCVFPWVFILILVVRVRIAFMYEPTALINRIGSTMPAIEQFVMFSPCDYDATFFCMPIQHMHAIEANEKAIVMELYDEGGSCKTTLRPPQPFLSFLDHHALLHHEGCSWREDKTQLDATDSTIKKSDTITAEEESALQSLLQLSVETAWRRFRFGVDLRNPKVDRAPQVFFHSMLEILTTSTIVERPIHSGEMEIVLNVSLFYDGVRIPTGRLGRQELIDRLLLTTTALQETLGKYYDNLRLALEELSSRPIIPLVDNQVLPPFRQPLFSDSQDEAYPVLNCLRQLYNQNLLLEQQICPKILGAAQAKSMQFEVHWGPVALLLLWIYFILCILALMFLSSDLGHRETNVQRRRRIFRQRLEDPVLRKEFERAAVVSFLNDPAAVDQYMADLDAKAALFLEEEADLEWRRRESRLAAWNERVRFLWVLRRGLVGALIISFSLLWIDEPMAEEILDGIMLVVATFGLTYVCLPSPPQEKSKKDQATELERPLLL